MVVRGREFGKRRYLKMTYFTIENSKGVGTLKTAWKGHKYSMYKKVRLIRWIYVML
jgi:hypothetical protein